MTNMPIIRLELEQMKYTLLAALSQHTSEINKLAEEQIAKAIKDFNWQAETTQVVHEALRTAIGTYFQYGKGYEFITGAVNEAFETMFKAVKK